MRVLLAALFFISAIGEPTAKAHPGKGRDGRIRREGHRTGPPYGRPRDPCCEDSGRGGALVRLSAGLSAGVSENFESRGVSGAGGDLTADVGVFLGRNLALHARGGVIHLVDGFGPYDYGIRRDAVATLLAPALTLYLPQDVYLTGAVGLGHIHSSDYPSTPGIGLNADLGKEWRLGTSTAFGLGLRFWHITVLQEKRLTRGFDALTGAGVFVSVAFH